MRRTNTYTVQVKYTSTEMRLQNVINEMRFLFEKFEKHHLIFFCRNHLQWWRASWNVFVTKLFSRLKKNKSFHGTWCVMREVIQKHFLSTIHTKTHYLWIFFIFRRAKFLILIVTYISIKIEAQKYHQNIVLLLHEKGLKIYVSVAEVP